MKRMLMCGAVLAFAGTAWGQTALNLTVKSTDFDSSTITVGPGCQVNYEVVGELSDAVNEGLALWGVDFELKTSGGANAGAVPQGDTPTEPPMDEFVVPKGVTNPDGYGGTIVGNVVKQAGGGQNTIRNVQDCTIDDDCPGASNTCDAGVCTASAPYPLGAVITGIAQPGSPEVLLTGSFTAPAAAGDYVFEFRDLFFNYIRDNETGIPFWHVDAGVPGTITSLSLTVEEGAACTSEVCTIVSSSPPSGAIDARQPHNIDGTNPDGWRFVDITFSCTRAADITAAEFSVTEPSGGDGVAAGIDTVTPQSADTVRVELLDRIEPGAWTKFTHTTSGTSVCLGYLPGDVNNDRTANPAIDLGALIDCINNPGTCATFRTNIDRLGTDPGALDITRLIDLYNGAGSFDSVTGSTLGAVPCP